MVQSIRPIRLQRKAPMFEPLEGRRLGTVFYCIGLTADWRDHLYETIVAHVSRLQEGPRCSGFRFCPFVLESGIGFPLWWVRIPAILISLLILLF